MFVKDRMSVNLVTVTEQTPVLEAGEIMRKHDFARLPVLRGETLVGIVTREDLQKVSPSKATTLSVWELNYVLSKLTVKEAMSNQPVTIDVGATLEEAALLMRSKKIGALPVMKAGQLVGIITESDIFDAFLELMGLRHTGTRLTIDLENRIGALADLTECIKKHGVNIVSMALFHGESQSGELVIRLDSPDSKVLVDHLRAEGYQIVHVANWSDGHK